jgi:hypothetical protein
MTTTSGTWLPRKLSRHFSLLDEVHLTPAALALLGIAAVLLHEWLRWPLHLPGRHGIEWLALLLFGRLTSRHPWAATVAGAAALAAAIGLDQGGTDLVASGPFYLLAGLAVDAVDRLLPHRCWNPLTGALVGAFAHATKPALLTGLGAMLGQAFWHPGDPPLGLLASYLLFGGCGGFIGTLLARRWLNPD